MGGEFLRYRFPDKLLLDVKYNIAHLEMFAIIAALKVWKHKLTGFRFCNACYNMACVELINRGQAHEVKMQQCLREVAYIAATNDFLIKAEYIRSCDNTMPDILSR